MFLKKYASPLVCGFAASVLSIIPELKIISCCLIVPAAAVLSLFLDQKMNKQNENIDSRKAITFGLLTGLFAALFATSFDILLTFILHNNDFVYTFPQTESLMRDYNLGPVLDDAIKMLKKMVSDIKIYGFSGLYSFAVLFSNLITNTVFGLIGGLIGMRYLNKNRNKL